MNITRADRERRRRYQDAGPKQFGTLHERMKYLLACAEACRLFEFDNDTWQAVLDLETEVSYHEPAVPPYGRRIAYRQGASNR
jgi:hypothetical protein